MVHTKICKSNVVINECCSVKWKIYYNRKSLSLKHLESNNANLTYLFDSTQLSNHAAYWYSNILHFHWRHPKQTPFDQQKPINKSCTRRSMHITLTWSIISSHNIPARTRPRRKYQPVKHGTEQLLNKHLLLIVVETGQLSPEGLAEEVCFHPGTLHQDFLIVEHLQPSYVLCLSMSCSDDVYICMHGTNKGQNKYFGWTS